MTSWLVTTCDAAVLGCCSRLRGHELLGARLLRGRPLLLQGWLAGPVVRAAGPAGVPVPARLLGPRHLRPGERRLRVRRLLDGAGLLAA